MGGSTKSIKSFTESIRKRDVGRERAEQRSYNLFNTARSRSTGPTSHPHPHPHSHPTPAPPPERPVRRQQTTPAVYAQDHASSAHVPFYRERGHRGDHGRSENGHHILSTTPRSESHDGAHELRPANVERKRSQQDIRDDRSDRRGNGIISPEELSESLHEHHISQHHSHPFMSHQDLRESLHDQQAVPQPRTENLHDHGIMSAVDLRERRSLRHDRRDQPETSSLRNKRDTSSSSLFSRARSGTPSTCSSASQSTYSNYSTLGHALRAAPAAAHTTTLRSLAAAASGSTPAQSQSQSSTTHPPPAYPTSAYPSTPEATPPTSSRSPADTLNSLQSSPYTPSSGLAPSLSTYDTVKIVAHRPEDVNAVRAALTHLQMVWSLYTSLNRPANLADAIERQLAVVSGAVDRLSDLPPFTITVPVSDGRTTPSSYHSSSSYHPSPPSEVHRSL